MQDMSIVLLLLFQALLMFRIIMQIKRYGNPTMLRDIRRNASESISKDKFRGNSPLYKNEVTQANIAHFLFMVTTAENFMVTAAENYI